MTQILLAAHGGHSSTGAARIAPLVAERLGAALDIVSVLPIPQPVDYGFGVVYAGGPEEDRALARAMAAEVAEQLARCGVVGRTPVIRRGQAAVEIAATARATGASLIVVGLGPHHALDRALGGETALQLVQIASTPVLAVPEGATTLPRRILVAVDFTPSSLLVARTAARLLAQGDVMRLVHVSAHATTTDATAREPRSGAPVADPAAHLEALASSLAVPQGAMLEHAVIEGPPANALLEALQRFGGDLIALGSHGYGLWKRLTIGSVASKVLRLATTAVLVQPIGSVVSAEGAPPANAP